MSYFKDLKTKEDWNKIGFFPNLSDDQSDQLFQLMDKLNTKINEHQLTFDGLNAVYGTLNRIFRTLVLEDYKDKPLILDQYENNIQDLVNLIDVDKVLGLFIGNISIKYVIQKYFKHIDGEQAFVNLFVQDYINGLVKEFDKNKNIIINGLNVESINLTKNDLK